MLFGVFSEFEVFVNVLKVKKIGCDFVLILCSVDFLVIDFVVVCCEGVR